MESKLDGIEVPVPSAQQWAVRLGPPETPKEKPPTMSSAAMPYTGGDIKRSGELGKMFDLHAEKSRKSGPLGSAPSRTASFGAANSNSGSLSKQKTNSGPLNKHGDLSKRSSGPQSAAAPPVLPTTGLITSGPILSGPLNSSGAPRKVSGSLDSTNSVKLHSTTLAHNQAVSKLIQDDTYSFKRSFPKPILWSVILLFVMGLIAGGFILGAVHNALLLIVVVVLFGAVSALFIWNSCSGRKAPIRFLNRYPDAELRTAKDGQLLHVEISPSSPRIKGFRDVFILLQAYMNTGVGTQSLQIPSIRFTWGLRAMERHVVDFYISDFQSGLRALVKTGYGAKVTPYVDESIVVDINPENKDKSPEFMRWLRERNLSSDGRLMRLREGYIKEGAHSSPEPLSTGCQWAECILPASLEGIILRSEDTSTIDVVPV
uniref:Uncharacterized protein n=1 Tax=Ananas comosus var. bracteatus TaxID=296719 RepID=A0A6V7PMH3_ANACO|nr:unnamed protein product [Ananas comosus var. bracteatus]